MTPEAMRRQLDLERPVQRGPELESTPRGLWLADRARGIYEDALAPALVVELAPAADRALVAARVDRALHDVLGRDRA